MPESPRPGALPLVLMVNDEEWTIRSIQSILSRDGYSVVTAYTGGQGVDLASRVSPDIVLVDLHLPDMSGGELCTLMRGLPAVRPGVPIIMLSSGQVSREERLDAYRRGAWDVLQPPFDPQELLARLEPYLGAKRDLDQALSCTDVDPLTGCYNVQGLMRRLREVSSEARRYHRPLACVVIGPSVVGEDPEGHGGRDGLDDERFIRRVSDAILTLKRSSDAVARMGPSDFVILAPGTDQEGAERLLQRVLERVKGDGEVSLGAGLFAVSGTDPDPPSPEEFLRRATNSLRGVQTGSNRVRTSGST